VAFVNLAPPALPVFFKGMDFTLLEALAVVLGVDSLSIDLAEEVRF
jgi:hypothetical protein